MTLDEQTRAELYAMKCILGEMLGRMSSMTTDPEHFLRVTANNVDKHIDKMKLKQFGEGYQAASDADFMAMREAIRERAGAFMASLKLQR